MPANNKNIIILSSILAVLLLLTGFLGFKYFTGGTLDLATISDKFQAATDSKPESIPPKTSPKPIGSGLQEFNFNHGNQVTGPKLIKVIVNPIDPQPGQTQTITATIKNDSPLTKANLIIETDHDITIQAMSLNKDTYQADIKLKDTYDYNYYIKFDLQSPTGNYSGGLRLRQPWKNTQSFSLSILS